ncbi:MAG: lipoprotein signal peptidase [Bacteroidaceae bacterium]|nr:lipoprotein signal peptidase [Bacteroidaceae bacterium]
MKKKAIISILIVLAVLVIDQIIKIEVKTNMMLGQHIEIAPWFQIAFVENNGMAFGMQFGAKIFLTLFRIVAVSVLGWYIYKMIKADKPMGYIVCLALIEAGAAGNIFDCLFYGEIFSESTPFEVATFVPWGEGYSDFLTGKVVDMFYFPLIEWNMPGWTWLNSIPLIPDAYDHCVFFSPVFNFADASISCSCIALILFYRKLFVLSLNENEGDKTNKNDNEDEKPSEE